jgi:hypothetical protein
MAGWPDELKSVAGAVELSAAVPCVEPDPPVLVQDQQLALESVGDEAPAAPRSGGGMPADCRRG